LCTRLKWFSVSSFITLVNLIFVFAKFFSIHAMYQMRRVTHMLKVFFRVPYVESLHDHVLQSNVTVRKLSRKSISPHLIFMTLMAQVTFRGSIGGPLNSVYS
jgi:hypothetical protein